ncbi:MAG: TonB-dependent receptor [Pseudomonadota bacterium]
MASAQEAEKAAEKTAAPPREEIESVVVVGTRASLRSALERKRAAGTISDSIVAEDIGQFPDKNVGEALSRVTGVQLSRDFGEGTQVSIRGVDPTLNRVEIDGASVLTANGASQRSADLRELASELVKSIDVIKGSTADMTEGGIGGTVSIELRKPLELDGPLFSASVSGQQLSTQGDWTPRANITAATQLFNERVGIMANVTYDRVKTRQDFLRNTEWVRLGDWDNSPEKTIESLNADYAAVGTEAGCLTAFAVAADQNNCRQQWWDYSPRIARYGIWERDDKRLSAQLTAQFRISDTQDLWVQAERTERKGFYNDRNYGTDFTAVNRVANVTTDVYDGLAANSNVTVDADHNVTAYTVANTAAGSLNTFSTAARGFTLRNTTDYLSAGYTYKGEQLQAKLGVSSTSSERFDQTNAVNFTAQTPGLRVELADNGVPGFIFPAGLSLEDDNVYSTMQLQYRPSENEVGERQGTMDFDFNPEWSVISSFEFGVQKRESTSLLYSGGGFLDANTGLNVPSSNINLTANLVPAATADTVVAGTGVNSHFLTYSWTPATFTTALANSTRSPGTFYGGYGGSFGGIPSDWRVPVFSGVADMMDISSFNHSELRHVLVNGVDTRQIPAHDITEDTFAEYFKVNIDTEMGGMRLSGNAGVRQVSTETESAGVLTVRTLTEGATPTSAPVTTTVGNRFVSVSREYTDTLPSVNLQLEIKKNFSVRLGYAELMSRPTITDLAPGANCLFDLRPGFSGDADPDDCTAGNPALKPFRAKSYDLEFAYYPTDEVEMRIGGFFKDINTFILARTLIRNVDLFANGTLFDVTLPVNGRGAKTQGVEASIQAPFTFLPGWASGFGGLANYTYSEAKNVNLFSQLDGSELPFPGLSKDSYNVVLYYDKGHINARVALNSRSDWLVSAADRSGNPVFRSGEDYLDARFQYRFNDDKISVFVEGKNLTDQAAISSAGSKVRLSELGWPGRRYFVGFSYKL